MPRATFSAIAASPLEAARFEPMWISSDETSGVATGRAPADAAAMTATAAQTTKTLTPTCSPKTECE